MYEFSAHRSHLIDWLDYQRRMDGSDLSLNKNCRIDRDNLDVWDL